jgi:hypothetical protein
MLTSSELTGTERTVLDAVDAAPLMAGYQIAYPLSVGSVRSGGSASTVPDLLIAQGRYGVRLHFAAGARCPVRKRSTPAFCRAGCAIGLSKIAWSIDVAIPTRIDHASTLADRIT